MKVTDYCSRAAPFDSHLKTNRGLIGVEVGVDVGAHAQALLQYCDVAMLYLVDVWPNPWCRGYCEGRLSPWRARVATKECGSLTAAKEFPAGTLDFVYIDQEHDRASVAADLAAWWPALKPGGVLGYRNYTGRGSPLDLAVDAFIAANAIRYQVETGEIVLLKP